MSLEKHSCQPTGQVWWVRQTLIMFTQWNSWPSVPSSSGVHIHGSGHWTDGTEGAKNLWAWTGCHRIFDLYVGTYNVRTWSSDDKLLYVEMELSKIKWTIIGLSEVWLKSKGCIIRNNTGHTMYYSGGNECQCKVGSVVNKSIAGNVVNLKGQSDKVAEITIRLNQWYQLKCIQVYMPTSSHPDEEVEQVYEDIANILSNSRAHYSIVMGDFNAKVGPRQCMEKCNGQYGLGERSQQGDMLVEFVEHHGLKIVNTLFKKHCNRCWTWICPNGETKNEIDYILTDKHGIFSDLSVLNSINTGINHRMVQGRAQINTRLERAKLTVQPKKIDTNKLKKHQVKFEAELQNRFRMLGGIPHDDLDATADTITKIVHETALLVGGWLQGEKTDKLSTRTKMLREKRRVMKRGGTTQDNLEYIQTCKAIRQGMKDDIQAFQWETSPWSHWEKQEPEACKTQAVHWKKQLMSIMEEDGTKIHNRDCIVTHCVEVYQELYRSRRLQINTIEPQQPHKPSMDDAPPVILPTEVEALIKKLDHSKAPGEENITGGVLQDSGEAVVNLLTWLFNKCLQLKYQKHSRMQ